MKQRFKIPLNLCFSFVQFLTFNYFYAKIVAYTTNFNKRGETNDNAYETDKHH